MAKLPDWMMDEAQPVPTSEELDALPGERGAWWRAHHARMRAAIEEFDAEYGAGEWEQAMLSVFPQPRGIWDEVGDDAETSTTEQDTEETDGHEIH